jgi:hypothetical protein
MNRRSFIAGTAAAAALSCARMEKREASYNEKQCPFCTERTGVCSYCGGTKKCTFCGGTGKRKTVASESADGNSKAAGSYEEKCPFCKGSGVCRYCNGTGLCLACKGTGTVENRDFFNKFNQSH